MADVPVVEGAGKAAGGVTEQLSRKIGPLPLWGWAVGIGLGGLVLRRFVMREQPKALTQASGVPVALPRAPVGGAAATSATTRPDCFNLGNT